MKFLRVFYVFGVLISSFAFAGKVSRLPDLPLPTLASFGAISIGSKIYIVSGHLGKQHYYERENYTTRSWVLDLSSEEPKWTPIADKPTASINPGMAYYGADIYAFGGFARFEKGDPKDSGWKGLDVVERFDTITGTWTTLEWKMPRVRSNSAVVRLEDDVYFVGGWNPPSQLENEVPSFAEAMANLIPEIDVFHLPSRKFRTLDTTLPNPLRRAVMGLADGEDLLFFGGLVRGFPPVTGMITRFRPGASESEQWAEDGSLPFAATNANVALRNGKIYWIGGQAGRGPYSDQILSRVVDNPEATWLDTGLRLSRGRSFAKVVELEDGRVVVLGGYEQINERDPLNSRSKGAIGISNVDLIDFD